MTEHGLPSAYAGFAMLPESIEEDDFAEENVPVAMSGDTPMAFTTPQDIYHWMN